MASAAEPSRSTLPLPTGWSDSSGDDLNATGVSKRVREFALLKPQKYVPRRP